MHRCLFTDRLEFIRGELVRTVRAEYGKESRLLDVYREYESGYTECRNLYLSVMGGYYVGFPGETNSYYRSGFATYIEKLDEWGECNCPGMNNHSNPINQVEKEIIIKHYPDFKYVLKKWSGSIHKVLYVLNVWKEHPEVEFMLAAGFELLVFDKRFWRLSEAKRKEVINFKKNNQGYYSLTDIQTILKYKLTEEDFREYNAFYYGKVRYDVFRYLQKIGMADYDGVELYHDYWKLLKLTNHNKNEDYWKFPKDLQKQHDKLMKEVDDRQKAELLEKLRKKQPKYYKAIKKYIDLKKDIDGFCIFIPETVEEIQRQAEILNQCLIRCDYISKVINHSCVLVFIQKNGVPIATAELKSDNTIGQFYADEHDRKNCLPSAEVKRAMNKWLKIKEAA